MTHVDIIYRLTRDLTGKTSVTIVDPERPITELPFADETQSVAPFDWGVRSDFDAAKPLAAAILSDLAEAAGLTREERTKVVRDQAFPFAVEWLATMPHEGGRIATEGVIRWLTGRMERAK